MKATTTAPFSRFSGLHPLAHLRRQRLPGADKLSDGGGLHLAHDVAAVELDGDLADPEVEGDLLVDPAVGQRAQDLSLTRGQGGKPLDMLLDDPILGPARDIPGDAGG